MSFLIVSRTFLSMPTKISYNLNEAAEAVGLSTKTLQRAIAAGDLIAYYPTSRGGRRARPLIKVDDLMEWLTSDRKTA